MKADRESAVVTACLQLLHLRGIWAWRANQGVIPLPGGGYRRFAGLKGVSDILGVLSRRLPDGSITGVFLAVECKKRGGRLSKEQRAFLDQVNELGGVGIVAHDAAELEKVLQGVMGRWAT